MEETNLSFRDNPFKHEGKPTSNFSVGTFCRAPKLLGIKQGVLFLILQQDFHLDGVCKALSGSAGKY